MFVFFQFIYFNMFFSFYFHVGNKQRFFKRIFFSLFVSVSHMKKTLLKNVLLWFTDGKKNHLKKFFFFIWNFLLQNFFPPKKTFFLLNMNAGVTGPDFTSCRLWRSDRKLFRDISTKNSNLHSQCSNA